jgi:2,3-bisphosphoglycerate-dependent phosphoglycerate mutase
MSGLQHRPTGPALLPAGRYASGLVTHADRSVPESSQFRQLRFEPPPGATVLLLVRHGQSEAYVDGKPFGLIGGQGDPALSPHGREQAELVCARLAAEGVDAIYVSNLRRTAQTAEPLARRLGLDPKEDADLREVHLGDWEGGLFRKMVATGHPVSLRMHAEERWDVIPGAEPGSEFTARIGAVIGRLSAAHPGQQVAVFTHGGVIGEVLAQASRSRPFAFTGADNASISRLVTTPERWIVRSFNDTAHLVV